MIAWKQKPESIGKQDTLPESLEFCTSVFRGCRNAQPLRIEWKALPGSAAKEQKLSLITRNPLLDLLTKQRCPLYIPLRDHTHIATII